MGSDIIADVKERKLIYLLSILSILFAVFGISLSFLALSSSLNIKDVVSPEVSGWDLYFDSISISDIEGSAKEVSRPYIDGKSTAVTNFNVSFDEYNDSIEYIINIVNGGLFDSKIFSITYSEPICYSTGPNAIKDSLMVCDNIEFKVTYTSGDEVKVGDVLNADSRENLKISLKYLGEDLPSNTVEIENLSMTIIYVQK